MSVHSCLDNGCEPHRDLHFVSPGGPLLYTPDGRTELVTVNEGKVLALGIALERDDPDVLRQAAQAVYDDVTR